jgi:hypothetical protein
MNRAIETEPEVAMSRPTRRWCSARRCLAEVLETRRLLAVFNCGETDDTVTVSTDGNSIRVFWNGVGAQVFTNPGVLTINLFGGQDTLNIWGTGTFPVDINVNMGAGNDATWFSPTARQLFQIQGDCHLRGEGGTDAVYAYDDNGGATTYTLTNARFDRPSWGGFYYEADIESLTLRPSNGNDVVNVLSTFSNQPITIDNPAGADVVNVGNPSQGVQNVSGDLHIYGVTGTNTVNISDAGNTIARSANFDWHNVSAFGRVNNLAPAKIIWETANTTHVNVTTGSSGDTLLVYSNTVPFTLNSAGGSDAVLIGDNIVQGCTYIWAAITVENNPDYTNLTINNYLDTLNRTWTIDTAGSYGSISGLGSAPIYWDNADINAIFLNCGRGVDTGHIKRLSETIVINNANGDNIDQIRFGDPAAGGLQSITPGRNGHVVIQNDPDYTDLIFDDTGDPTARTVELDVVSGYNELSGLAPATFRFDDNDVKQVTVVTGGGIDNLTVLRAGTNGGNLTILSTGGNDAVTLGNTVSGMQEIIGDVDIANSPALTVLKLFNRPDTVARSVSHFYPGTGNFIHVTGLHPGTLRYNYQDVASVELDGGGGTDSYSIAATVNGRPFRLETGAGSDNLTVGGAGVLTNVELIEPVILDASLSILNDGRVQLAGSSSSQIMVINSLDLGGNGTLDIRDKQAILNYTGASPAGAIRAVVASGYAAGAWSGAGITSSVAQVTPGTAVGFAEAADMYTVFPSSWFGQTIDNTAILFRHTLTGDTNLDRSVNLADFNRLASNFGQINRIFGQGDFNYDGTANLGDFNILAGRFGDAMGPDGGRDRVPSGRASASALLDELFDPAA